MKKGDVHQFNLVFKRVIVLGVFRRYALAMVMSYVDLNPKYLTNYIRKVVKLGEFLSDILFASQSMSINVVIDG